MENRMQPWRRRVDEVSTPQYSFPANSRLRRAPLENTQDGMDYYAHAFETLQDYITPDARILSVGAGDGLDEVRWVKEFGHEGEVVCLDLPSEESQADFFSRFDLAQAELNAAGKNNVIFVPGNVQDLPFKDNEFDAVAANHMTYHSPDIILALLEIRRVLRWEGKFEHLTNGRENSSLRHSALKDMGKILGAKPPKPFSARFNQQRAEKIIPYFFNLLEPIEQDSVVPISDASSLDTFMLSVDTYKSAFRGDTTQWIPARERVQEKLWQKIKKDGVIYERVQRGGGIYENSLNNQFIKKFLGNLALTSYQTIDKLT